MKVISVCICTRRRPEGLRRLLASLKRIKIPEGLILKIIIVENDSVNRSQEIVNDFSAMTYFQISYFLETRQGLSFARNRSVKEAQGSDFYCFVDDDQEVAPDWLEELLKCQSEFKADGVWGPNPPVFKRDVPVYIKRFYSPDIYQYGEVVKKAHTNCLLLGKECLEKINGPFDERLNFTGGEDSYLTSMISENGYIIRFNPCAIAYEIVPDNRTTLNYVFKRTSRISYAGMVIKSFQKDSFKKTEEFTRLILRFVFGSLILIPYFVFSRRDRIKGWIKIANAVGGFSFFIGRHNNFYK
jgi:succinoglycan biosynthesis protein ExoM